MLEFPFVDLCLNLLHHMQRCRFGSVIILIRTKNKPAATSTNASIVDEAIFYADFFIA